MIWIVYQSFVVKIKQISEIPWNILAYLSKSISQEEKNNNNNNMSLNIYGQKESKDELASWYWIEYQSQFTYFKISQNRTLIKNFTQNVFCLAKKHTCGPVSRRFTIYSKLDNRSRIFVAWNLYFWVLSTRAAVVIKYIQKQYSFLFLLSNSNGICNWTSCFKIRLLDGKYFFLANSHGKNQLGFTVWTYIPHKILIKPQNSGKQILLLEH